MAWLALGFASQKKWRSPESEETGVKSLGLVARNVRLTESKAEAATAVVVVE